MSSEENIESKVDEEYDKMVSYLKKQNLSMEELKILTKQSQTYEKQTHNQHNHFYGSRHTKIGIVSDLHYGHNNFRLDVFEDSVKVFNKEKVDAIYCPGDLTEGMSNRDGHFYELAVAGVTKQVHGVAELLNQYKQPLHFILGNHDLWGMKKGNQGVNIGKEVESLCPNATYLGDMKADVFLSPSCKMELSHEGSAAYALSYSMQKRINAISGGDKPHIKVNGHIHKMLYMFYRNIHAIEAGTLEDQTEFMAMKGTPSHVGFWTLDIFYNKQGINRFTPTMYPYY